MSRYIQNIKERKAAGTGIMETGFSPWRGLVPAGLLALLFSVLAEDIVSHEIYAFDGAVTGFVRQFTDPRVVLVMKALTMLGSPGVIAVLVIAAAAALLLSGRPPGEPILLIAAASGSMIINELLKVAFHRPRPEVEQLVHAAGYSFPSGHSMTGMAFFGALAYLLWTYRSPAFVRRVIAAFLLLLAFFIGVSRIYVGVHFPSDVLGGFAAGGAWLAVCITAWRYLPVRRV
ncbi:MAG: phosphatase PAP2 family protein [Bacillota bacterium]